MKIVLANGACTLNTSFFFFFGRKRKLHLILQTMHFSMSITCRLCFELRLHCCTHKHTSPSIESELFQGQCYEEYTVPYAHGVIEQVAEK